MGSIAHLGEFKKHASFFFRESLKSARLKLTDVTKIELMTEEATNADPWGPETRVMSAISQAAFEVDEYWRIVRVLHQRLGDFDRKCWREIFKTLALLEYILTHGPESFAREFQSEEEILSQLTHFEPGDDIRKGDCGQNIRKKASGILKLLADDALLKQERENARRVTRGIKGFGSFSLHSSPHIDKSISLDNYHKHGEKEAEEMESSNLARRHTFAEDHSNLAVHSLGHGSSKTDSNGKNDFRKEHDDTPWNAFEDMQMQTEMEASNLAIEYQYRSRQKKPDSEMPNSHKFLDDYDESLFKESLIGDTRNHSVQEDHVAHPFFEFEDDTRKCFISSARE